ncbi:MAG: hypothetical protein AAGD13_09245 [Pseudomonadota bacterium]
MKKLLCAAGILAVCNTAAAADPRALVTDVIGTTTPEIFAFDEIDAGTTIVLGASSEVRLTFYPTCEDVAVRGGEIAIFDTHMTIEGDGELLEYIEGNCPSAVKLTESDIINAAVISRAMNVRIDPEISLRPVVGVGGANAGAFHTIIVTGSRGMRVAMPIVGRKGVWPADAEPLKNGKKYGIAIIGDTVKPRVAKVIANSDAPELLVLRY